MINDSDNTGGFEKVFFSKDIEFTKTPFYENSYRINSAPVFIPFSDKGTPVTFVEEKNGSLWFKELDGKKIEVCLSRTQLEASLGKLIPGTSYQMIIE